MLVVIGGLVVFALLAELGMYFLLGGQETDDVSW